MEYIIVSNNPPLFLYTSSLLSFSSLTPVSSKTDPLLFQLLYMPMVFSLSPCSSFLLEMSACTDPNCLAPAFPFFSLLFFFSVKRRPGWAAGGHSHIKITMSHPGDLCMCQRVQSQHTHTHAHTLSDGNTLSLRCIIYNYKTCWEAYTKDSCLFFPCGAPTFAVLSCHLFLKSMFLLTRCLLTKLYSFLYSLILSNAMCVSAVYPGMAY